MEHYSVRYEITNTSGKAQYITRISLLVDRATSGYFVQGTHYVERASTGEIISKSDDYRLYGTLNGYEFNTYIEVLPGEMIVFAMDDIGIPRRLEAFNIALPEFQVSCVPGMFLGNLNLELYRENPPVIPVGGALIDGGNYVTPSFGGVYGRVWKWTYPASFSTKQLIPPPPPPALYWPTVAGPNYDGTIDGLLKTPATVTGIVREDGTIADIDAAGVQFTLSAGTIETVVRVGIHPFKDGEA